MDDLDAGSLFAELHIAAWPPPITQTLLRKSDGRLTLTVRGKPSGRLRVALERQGYEPIVVRTVHLRLRAPTVLKATVAWRGTEAVVAAGGQVIGSTDTFNPEGVVTPAEVEQTAAPLDHVDNARMRDLRRKQVAAFLSNSLSAGALAERWMADLAEDTKVLGDLTVLIRQGHGHHLPGLMRAIRLLVLGDDREPALLQFCAGMVDTPLILCTPAQPARAETPSAMLAAAFAVAPARDAAHGLAIDVDAWLRTEVPWTDGNLPIGWLLRQVDEALAPGRRENRSALDAELVRAPEVAAALCTFAVSLCDLAEEVMRAPVREQVEPPTIQAAQ